MVDGDGSDGDDENGGTGGDGSDGDRIGGVDGGMDTMHFKAQLDGKYLSYQNKNKYQTTIIV